MKNVLYAFTKDPYNRTYFTFHTRSVKKVDNAMDLIGHSVEAYDVTTKSFSWKIKHSVQVRFLDRFGFKFTVEKT